jgi:hypothetical protein
MKQLGTVLFWLISGLAVLFAIAATVWILKAGLPFKRQYANLKSQTSEVYKVLPLDQLTKVELSEVLEQWTCRFEDTNRITIAVSAKGLTPSVQNWIRLFNSPTPDFSWLDLSGARKAGFFNIVKLGLLDFSSDHTFYVSDDGRIALLRDEETGAVSLFQDQGSVVRFALYSRTRKSIEPDGPANGSQPTRSKTNSTSSAAVSRR